MQIHSVGIDLGKTTFHLVALGVAGKVLVEKKFTWKQLLAHTANMQTSLIALGACSGAHFLGRALRKQRSMKWDCGHLRSESEATLQRSASNRSSF
jgi:transposase